MGFCSFPRPSASDRNSSRQAQNYYRTLRLSIFCYSFPCTFPNTYLNRIRRAYPACLPGRMAKAARLVMKLQCRKCSGDNETTSPPAGARCKPCQHFYAHWFVDECACFHSLPNVKGGFWGIWSRFSDFRQPPPLVGIK